MFEHDTVTVGELRSASGLSAREAEHLSHVASLKRGFIDRGHQSVRFSQYCGVVTLGDRTLEILPKTEREPSPTRSRALFLRLLNLSQNASLFRYLQAGQDLERAPLLEVFIGEFFNSVRDVIRGGLLRQYRTIEDDLFVVRGRILPQRQFAVLANRVDRVACSFDELTDDNLWNRVAKAGLRAVKPWVKAVDLTRRWIELMTVFDEVTDLPFTARELDHLVFDRQAARYRQVVEWVRIILSMQSPALRAGEREAPGLLFDMNMLFQSAVAAMLRRSVDSTTEVLAQDSSKSLATRSGPDASPQFRLKPDLVIRRGRTVVAVGDTKWKRVELTADGYFKPSELDVYRMTAYAVAYGCQELALLYPWHEGLRGSKETTFELKAIGEMKPRLSVVCVDVGDERLRLKRGAGTTEFGRILGSVL